MGKHWSPLTKVILISILSFLALYVSLPNRLPIKFQLGNFSVDKEFTRKDLNFSFGRVAIKKQFNLVLGLDLAGGSHLVFEADVSGIDENRRETAIEAVKEVMEKRVNLFGISEPNVVTSSFEGKERIIVELPGVKDTKQAIELIGQTAQLVFAETGSEEEPSITPTDLTGADLKSAEVVFDQTSGKPAVGLEFTVEGGQKFAELTSRNIGKPLPILLDNAIVSAPVV